MTRIKKKKKQNRPSRTKNKKQPFFSFLLPTRKRPDLVSRFFNSIVENTADLQNLEIVMAVDNDDTVSQKIEDTRLDLKKVIIPKGATMGNLNRACYDTSCGRFVMLVNDDLILRTKNWDNKVQAAIGSVGDDICLIHVNELMFKERLCTFPMISRKACDAIELCPKGYERYRIDDHIYDTYSLLAHLGYPRIFYLEDIVFEHENHEAMVNADDAHFFKSSENKVYRPNQEIIVRDARLFEDTLEDRKRNAKKLAGLIEEFAKQKRQDEWSRKLDEAKDSYCYRRPDYYRTYPETKWRYRTTVAVSTANIYSPHAARCIKALKECSSNIDLVIMDNNGSKDFSHPRDMNQMLDSVSTRYLVLVDDDVYVEPGWLDGLHRALDDQTGVVLPLHKDADGKLSFSGCYIGGDSRGSHAHLLDMPMEKRVTPCYCSAIMLIDMEKVGHIQMDRTYEKYFFDIVHGLEVWESGYEAVVTPEVMVTHVGGATAIRGTNTFNATWQRDGDRFAQQWIQTGRLSKLQNTVWRNYPFFQQLMRHQDTIRWVIHKLRFAPIRDVSSTLLSLVIAYKDWDGLRPMIIEEMFRTANEIREGGDAPRAQFYFSVVALIQSKPDQIQNQSTAQVERCLMNIENFLNMEKAECPVAQM